MSRRIKKFLLGLLAAVALSANALLLIRGPSKKETDDKGEKNRNPFLAGTAVTSILAPVCIPVTRRYCSECGSRV